MLDGGTQLSVTTKQQKKKKSILQKLSLFSNFLVLVYIQKH